MKLSALPLATRPLATARPCHARPTRQPSVSPATQRPTSPNSASGRHEKPLPGMARALSRKVENRKKSPNPTKPPASGVPQVRSCGACGRTAVLCTDSRDRGPCGISSEEFPSWVGSAFGHNAIVRPLSHGKVTCHRPWTFPFESQDRQSSQGAPIRTVELPDKMYSTLLSTIKCRMIRPQWHSCRCGLINTYCSTAVMLLCRWVCR